MTSGSPSSVAEGGASGGVASADQGVLLSSRLDEGDATAPDHPDEGGIADVGQDAGVDDGGDAGPPTAADFDAERVHDPFAACEEVPGLTLNALLERRTDAVFANFGYFLWESPDDQALGNATSFTVTLTWLNNPEALCYPAWESPEPPTLVAAPRLAVEGLVLRFRTADGLFDETMDAKAWAFSRDDVVTSFAVIAGRHYDDLEGSYVIPPALVPSLRWITFRVGLVGSESGATGSGTVGAWPELRAAEIQHGIFPGGAALGGYPAD